MTKHLGLQPHNPISFALSQSPLTLSISLMKVWWWQTECRV